MSVATKPKPQSGFLAAVKSKLEQSSNGNFGNIFRIGDGEKKRLRFLTEADEGIKVVMHSKWTEDENNNGSNTCVLQTPCLTHFGKACQYCDQTGVDTVDNYAFLVYDYEAKKLEVFLYKLSKKSILVQLAEVYEEVGTILDRDITVKRNGSRFETTYQMIPGAPKEFTVTVKTMSQDAILRWVIEAFAPDIADSIFKGKKAKAPPVEEEDDEEEVQPRKKASAAAPSAKKKAPPVEEEDDEDEETEDDEEEEEEEAPPPPKRTKAAAAPTKKKRAADPFEDEDDD